MPVFVVRAAIFRRPYLEVIKGVPPFLALMLVANVLIILFRDIVMFLPNAMITIGWKGGVSK